MCSGSFLVEEEDSYFTYFSALTWVFILSSPAHECSRLTVARLKHAHTSPLPQFIHLFVCFLPCVCFHFFFTKHRSTCRSMSSPKRNLQWSWTLIGPSILIYCIGVYEEFTGSDSFEFPNRDFGQFSEIVYFQFQLMALTYQQLVSQVPHSDGNDTHDFLIWSLRYWATTFSVSLVAFTGLQSILRVFHPTALKRRT